MDKTLSPSPQPKAFVCASCGTTSEAATGWFVRATKEGEVALCPDCTMKVQQELAQQGQDINMPRAVLFGAVAAALASAAWYGLVVATDYKLGIVAIGVGWLVGKAVVLGAGNKRSTSLQVAGGLLALVALAGGEYLIINHLVRKFVENFTGWLTLEQFFDIYPKVLVGDNGTGWILDVVFYLIAIYMGAMQPRPVKLEA